MAESEARLGGHAGPVWLCGQAAIQATIQEASAFPMVRAWTCPCTRGAAASPILRWIQHRPVRLAVPARYRIALRVASSGREADGNPPKPRSAILPDSKDKVSRSSGR